MGKVVKTVAIIAAAAAIAYFAPALGAAFLKAVGVTAVAGSAAATAATAAAAVALTMAASYAMAVIAGKPQASATATMFRQSITNARIIYGKRRASGVIVFFHGLLAGKFHYRFFVIAVAGHRCKGVTRWYLNDEVVTVRGDGLVMTGAYANDAWLWFGRGTDAQEAPATFLSDTNGKWTAAHVGKGVAKIYAKFRMTEAVIAAGIPNISAEIEGKDDIRDPRTGARGYMRNAAAVFYDWLGMAREDGGFGAYPDEMPDDAWLAAQANVSDEIVPTSGTLVVVGANAGATSLRLASTAGLEPGTIITIARASGESEQRAIAAIFADGLVDVTQAFSRSYDAGSSVSWAGAVEERYAFDSVIEVGAAPSEVRQTFVTCCAGTYSYSGGKHLMRVGYFVPVSAELHEEDLAGPISIPLLAEEGDLATEFSGTFVDPQSLYQPQAVPTRSVASVDVRQADADLPHITSSTRGQRILEIMLRRAQAEKRVTWPMNIMGLEVSAMDTVRLATPRHGLSNYAWTVASWGMSSDYGVTMSLREENEEIYSWGAAMERPRTGSASLDPVQPIGDTNPAVEQLLIANSYPIGISIIATDANGSATVTISDHQRVYGDRTVTVIGATITGLQNSTAYYLYYDDPDRVGGAVAFVASVNMPDGFYSVAHPARHSVGTVTTPASGGGETGGGGSTPPGGGGGSNPNTQIP